MEAIGILNLGKAPEKDEITSKIIKYIGQQGMQE